MWKLDETTIYDPATGICYELLGSTVVTSNAYAPEEEHGISFCGTCAENLWEMLKLKAE